MFDYRRVDHVPIESHGDHWGSPWLPWLPSHSPSWDRSIVGDEVRIQVHTPHWDGEGKESKCAILTHLGHCSEMDGHEVVFFNLSLFIILELYAMINYNIFIYTYTYIYIHIHIYIRTYIHIYYHIIYIIYTIFILYIYILYIYYIIYIYIILYIDYIYLYLNITKASNRSANACETLVAANPGSSNWKWRQSTPRVAARDC